MKKYLSILKSSKMFRGIKENEILPLMGCLKVNIKKYKKGEYVIRSGDKVNFIGMVLSGLLIIEKEDYWGNNAILQELIPGSLFAESYACLPEAPVEVSVLANSDTEVMFFDLHKILYMCSNSCSYHTQLIFNLASTISEKNINLTKKVEYITKKTIRERVLAYLSNEAIKQGSSSIHIPFNRQQLSEYLSVDRSALSNEIGKLQREGLITCKKNHFILHEDLDSSLDIIN